MTPSLAHNVPATSLAPDPQALHWSGHMADHVGATYGQKPLAFLQATPDELLLSGNRGTFRFPRATVVKVGRGGLYPWCFSSVRIRHSIAGFPVELQFKPLDTTPAAVLEKLKSLGYPAR